MHSLFAWAVCSRLCSIQHAVQYTAGCAVYSRTCSIQQDVQYTPGSAFMYSFEIYNYVQIPLSENNTLVNMH